MAYTSARTFHILNWFIILAPPQTVCSTVLPSWRHLSPSYSLTALSPKRHEGKPKRNLRASLAAGRSHFCSLWAEGLASPGERGIYKTGWTQDRSFHLAILLCPPELWQASWMGVEVLCSWLWSVSDGLSPCLCAKSLQSCLWVKFPSREMSTSVFLPGKSIEEPGQTAVHRVASQIELGD